MTKNILAILCTSVLCYLIITNASILYIIFTTLLFIIWQLIIYYFLIIDFKKYEKFKKETLKIKDN